MSKQPKTGFLTIDEMAMLVKLLDEVSRRRALDPSESVLLERMIRCVDDGPVPINHRARRDWCWTPEEDYLASKLRREGWPCSMIALRLPRTPDAIASRLKALGVKRPAEVGKLMEALS